MKCLVRHHVPLKATSTALTRLQFPDASVCVYSLPSYRYQTISSPLAVHRILRSGFPFITLLIFIIIIIITIIVVKWYHK